MNNKKNLYFIIGTLILTLATILIIKFTPQACKSNTSQENDILVTLVLDLGGANDQSFNESALSGAERIVSTTEGIEMRFLESNQEGDYMTNIENAIDLDSDLIIGVGFNLTDAIKTAAINYPEQNFAIIDGAFDGEIPSNVKPLLFNEADAGYLAGIIAARETDSDKFGFVGGFEIPAVINFKEGFEKGLKEVNPNAILNVQYANSFSDAAKGKVIAQSMHSSGVSTIMTAAGGVNQGVYEACRESNNYAVAVDMAQSHISPDTILTSALKNVDVAVEDAIKDLINGKFSGGEASMYNLSNNGVGYEKTSLIKEDTLDYIEDKKKSL